jgi:hypothetical protein
MILVLFDDRTIGNFNSPNHPPNSIEWIDVENEEYVFCDEMGQLYKGELVQPAWFLKAEQWQLIPVGEPDLANIQALLDQAVDVDQDDCSFADLASLKEHLANKLKQ